VARVAGRVAGRAAIAVELDRCKKHLQGRSCKEGMMKERVQGSSGGGRAGLEGPTASLPLFSWPMTYDERADTHTCANHWGKKAATEVQQQGDEQAFFSVFCLFVETQ